MKIAYKIIADGDDITAMIADRLLSAEITDEAGVKSDRMTMVLDDRDQRLELPKTGAKLDVLLGYAGKALVKMGRYVVDEVSVSGPLRSITVIASAADMTGSIKAPKERSFDNITLGSLVKTIASDNGLTPAVSSDLAVRNLGHIDQTESDMQLLQRICADQGATCKVADGRLVVAVHGAGKTTSGGQLPKITIDAGDCESWSATFQDRSKYKSVRAYWQDTSKARRTSVTAGNGKPEITLKNTYASAAEAQRAASSKYKALESGTARMSISGLIGDPSMSAEALAILTGFRAGLDDDGWVVNTVVHSFSDSGYTCSLEMEKT